MRESEENGKCRKSLVAWVGPERIKKTNQGSLFFIIKMVVLYMESHDPLPGRVFRGVYPRTYGAGMVVERGYGTGVIFWLDLRSGATGNIIPNAKY